MKTRRDVTYYPSFACFSCSRTCITIEVEDVVVVVVTVIIEVGVIIVVVVSVGLL